MTSLPVTETPDRTAQPAEGFYEMYRRMRLIRQFEDRASRLYRSNEIPGFLHLSIGQEASAIGACWPLDDHDVITSPTGGTATASPRASTSPGCSPS